MSPRCFVDTNVLVYASDRRDLRKSDRAHALLDGGEQFVLSTQVLGEWYVTVTRKLRPTLSAEAARAALAPLLLLPVVPTDVDMVRSAVATAASTQMSYWDALIVEAAVAGGCERIYTEDLTAGQVIRGVEIVDPFN